jgi:hypothetical protein
MAATVGNAVPHRYNRDLHSGAGREEIGDIPGQAKKEF